MRNRVRLLAILLTLSSVTGVGLAARGGRDASRGARQSQAPEPEKPAEQVYRNIQVFKGLPASQLLGAMNFMAGSLGVACNHCHVGNQFAKDDKPAKQTARRMILMMRKINEENFAGNLNVTCATCHAGQTRPKVVAPLPSLPPPAAAAAAPTNAPGAEPSPSVDEVLEKYVRALGGRAEVEKVTALVMEGQQTSMSGPNPPSSNALQVYRKAPDKLMLVSVTPGGSFTQAYNGTAAWRQSGARVSPVAGADLLGAKRDANFFRHVNLKPQYASLAAAGREVLNGRDALVLEGTFADDSPEKTVFGMQTERLYFDAQTGLLVRRTIIYRTPLGPLPEVTDLEDYRKVGGVLMPFTVRVTRPPFVNVQKFTKIEPNAPLDDAKFDMPAAK